MAKYCKEYFKGIKKCSDCSEKNCNNYTEEELKKLKESEEFLIMYNLFSSLKK